ncbi:MAG: preprotein translocase subunit YajC [Saprospiraceae bacterium]|nr:preprotein translocase subunit YajC [Saprospiraceae bacterium]
MLFLQAGGLGGVAQFLPLAMILVVFYFFMIRPQMKRQKEQTSFAESLEKGKEVVTSSGIIGKINKIEGQVVTLEVANNTYIRVTKGSISKEMTEAFLTTKA